MTFDKSCVEVKDRKKEEKNRLKRECNTRPVDGRGDKKVRPSVNKYPFRAGPHISFSVPGTLNRLSVRPPDFLVCGRRYTGAVDSHQHLF